MAKQDKPQIEVEGLSINLSQEQEGDFISLTDMVRGEKRPDDIIRNWLRTRATLRFLAAWETLNNPDFNPVEFDGIMQVAGDPTFTLSVSEWRDRVQAVGIRARRGRYGGTYAHADIAFEFGAYISPMFKLLLIREFQRLKQRETQQLDREWDAHRFLSKRNYEMHTETIKNFLLRGRDDAPNEQWLTYAEEADMLNVIIFGQTAREWKGEHQEAASHGLNQRDFATNEQLIVLSNLESLNAELLRDRLPKEERYYKLRDAANYQLGLLYRMRLKRKDKQLPGQED
jgi:hypothetical protein